MGSSCAAGFDRYRRSLYTQIWRFSPIYWLLQPFRNRHWQSLCRYHNVDAAALPRLRSAAQELEVGGQDLLRPTHECRTLLAILASDAARQRELLCTVARHQHLPVERRGVI
jgi:hypothetical protein